MDLTHAHAQSRIIPIKEDPMAKKKPAYERPRCPTCKSGRIQVRKTDRKAWCRQCLYEGAVEEFSTNKSAAA